MKHTIVLGAALATLVAVVQPAAAQDAASPPDSARAAMDVADYARAMLGVTLSTSGTDRDTLGLLISAVIPGGPADRAGIDAGSRLAEIDSVSLRVIPAEIGQPPAEALAIRRLEDQLRVTQAGDYVRLRLFTGGHFRTMTVQTPRTTSAARSAEVPGGVILPATVTLQGVVKGIGDLRMQLDRLRQDTIVAAPRDTLLRAELELGAIERRLRSAQLGPRRADTGAGSMPGLRVATVTDELKDYFGEESDGGLLVVDCDLSWDPLRKGDVILRVDGEPADVERLRNALDPLRETRVDLLRRGHYLKIAVRPRA